jgi:hypothetical protein
MNSFEYIIYFTREIKKMNTEENIIPREEYATARQASFTFKKRNASPGPADVRSAATSR